MYKLKRLPQFDKWLLRLKDRIAKSSIESRLEMAETGNLGETRHVGNNVHEMKINIGAGYRVYYSHMGKILIIIMMGGDKSSQKKDIKLAHKIAKELKENDHD